MPLLRKWYANHSFRNAGFFLSLSLSESPPNWINKLQSNKWRRKKYDRMKQINLIIYRSHMTLNSEIMISMREMQIFRNLFSSNRTLSNPNTCNKSYTMSDILMRCLLLCLPSFTYSAQRREKSRKNLSTNE